MITSTLKEKGISYLKYILEYSIYVYCFALFFDTFSAVKAISIYLAIFSFILLLILERPKNTKNINIIFFFLLTISVLLSSVFSIDPEYSFSNIKKEFVKSFLLFMSIALFFDTKQIRRLMMVFTGSIFVFLLSGLYSYINFDLDFFTSQTFLVDANQNEYACNIGFIFPFIISLFFIFQKKYLKFSMLILMLFAFMGIILSGTRGAMGAAVTTLLIFVFFVIREILHETNKKHTKNLYIIIISVLITFILSSFFWGEGLKQHLGKTMEHFGTFDNRTEFFWKPAVEAIKKRPVFGWGYGKKIYRNPEVFKDIEPKPFYELKGGLHNTFITVFFHQGIFGGLIYILLIFSCIISLIKTMSKIKFPEKAIYIGLLCAFIGSMTLNSIVISISFLNTAPFFGMAAALTNQHNRNI